MNVLQVTKGALMGGGEKHVLALLEGFKDRSVDMSLAVFTEGPLSAAARNLGVDVYIVQKRYRGDIAPLLKLIRLIKTKQIDIVHTHLISGNFYGRLAGKATRVKGIVSTLHHSDRDALGQFSPAFLQDLFFRLDILMTVLSDRIVTPSDDLRRLLINRVVKKDKIVSIPNGIGLDHQQLVVEEHDMPVRRQRLGFPLDVKLVGMVGRLVSAKNFDLFIRSAKRVIDSGMKAKFVLIGDGPLRAKLQKTAAELWLTEQVIFTGFRKDALDIISILDVFVLCSKSETFPLALIEAMSLKKPVIATNVGGVPEIIDHMVNGWLCRSGDEVSLANSIIYLLGDEKKARELGNRAHQKVMANFNLRTMTDKLLKVYYELAH